MVLAAALFPLYAPVSQGQEPASPRIGLSGSFYALDGLTIPVGGSVNSSDIYVVVYNYGEEPIEAVLNYSAPEGIKVVFQGWENPRLLYPGEHARVSLAIIVNEDVVPGNYTIVVYASERRETEGGVVVVPAAAQDAWIIVSGEYAVLHAYALDPAGRLVEDALLKVYTVVAGNEISVVDSYGELHARLVPGDYVVRAYLRGELSAEERVRLDPFEEETVELRLRIVYFEFFAVQPMTGEEGRLLSAQVHAVVVNLYRTINDSTIVLRVERDGVLVEEKAVQEASILPLGRIEYRFDYVPAGGWESGNYTFAMRVYGLGGRLLAESEPVWLYYEAPRPLWLRLLPLLAVAAAAVFVAVAGWARSRRRRGGGRASS